MQQNYLDELNADKIKCVNDLQIVNDNSLDVCFSFHVIEHLPDPIKTLSILKNKLVKGGKLVIEVPHANDFLLKTISNKDFKQFTLWSQHLIMHTRESLYIVFCNLLALRKSILLEYNDTLLSNHLNWLVNGRPGGHKSPLSYRLKYTK